MDDHLTITVDLGDAGSAIQDGSVVRMTGTTDDGRQVVWAGDTRIVADLLQALMLGEEDEITVVLEDWQILSITSPVLGTEESLELMMHLDNGSSLFGKLGSDARARIFAVVDQPSESSWDSSYSIILTSEPRVTTLWQALLRHTDYSVTSRPEGPWPVLPTRTQILTALKEVLS
jgi:hypothetical protein